MDSAAASYPSAAWSLLSIGCLECLGRKLCIVDFFAATAGPHIHRLRTRNALRLRARKLAKLSWTCDS
jgi:hypothetical protein